MYLEEECFILSFWFGRGVFYIGDLLFRGDSPEDSASRWILVALSVSIAIAGCHFRSRKALPRDFRLFYSSLSIGGVWQNALGTCHSVVLTSHDFFLFPYRCRRPRSAGT